MTPTQTSCTIFAREIPSKGTSHILASNFDTPQNNCAPVNDHIFSHQLWSPKKSYTTTPISLGFIMAPYESPPDPSRAQKIPSSQQCLWSLDRSWSPPSWRPKMLAWRPDTFHPAREKHQLVAGFSDGFLGGRFLGAQKFKGPFLHVGICDFREKMYPTKAQNSQHPGAFVC